MIGRYFLDLPVFFWAYGFYVYEACLIHRYQKIYYREVDDLPRVLFLGGVFDYPPEVYGYCVYQPGDPHDLLF